MDNQTNISAIEVLEFNKSREQRSKKILYRPKRSHAVLTFFALLALIFSFYLMFHTFSYDSKSHSMLISSKLWSDFGAHIPLIRSFSHGSNFTRLLAGQAIESPLFPGEPVRYHVGFYAIAGILEKIGLPIDWAVNIPSALGFFALLVGIWAVSFVLFRSYAVSALSVIFFLSNGSLSFIRYFSEHPISVRTVTDIVTNSRFTSFGPWDGGTISAFWTLNIYTNQRHLALSYALVLAVIKLFGTAGTTRARQNNTTGIIIGIALLSTILVTNYAAAGIAAIFLVWFFLSIPHHRKKILLAILGTLPAFMYINHSANLASLISWEPGYLISSRLSLPSFFSFWRDNIGLHALLIPLGLALAPRAHRRTYGVPLLLLFVLPNLFRFSADMINNHKFFNFFVLFGAMFSAYALTRIFRNRQFGVLAALVGFVCLTLSGVLDLFPVINDYKGKIADSGADPVVAYFARIPPDAVVANSTWFYHPASIAGRALFSGYTYFTWSYGYNQTVREQAQIALYQSPTIERACMLLDAHDISYIEVSRHPETYLHINYALWDSLVPDYVHEARGIAVYQTATICPSPSNIIGFAL